MWRDHPRMRGEKKKRHFYMGLSLGSPPHARGKDEEGVERRFQGGITPACAGKRHQHAAKATAFEDHPRMRGEKL